MIVTWQKAKIFILENVLILLIIVLGTVARVWQLQGSLVWAFLSVLSLIACYEFICIYVGKKQALIGTMLVAASPFLIIIARTETNLNLLAGLFILLLFNWMVVFSGYRSGFINSRQSLVVAITLFHVLVFGIIFFLIPTLRLAVLMILEVLLSILISLTMFQLPRYLFVVILSALIISSTLKLLEILTPFLVL